MTLRSDNTDFINAIKVRVFFEKNIEKSTFVVTIRIIITFANQIVL